MSRSFPNMFISPCPFQQSVITANFTLATTESWNKREGGREERTE